MSGTSSFRPRGRHLLAAAAIAAGASLSGIAMARDLVVALKTEPTSMDPQYHALTPNIQLSQTLFDPMVCVDADASVRPASSSMTWA